MMKTISTQQILAVSGGTQNEVNRYQDWVLGGSAFGATAGAIGGIVYAMGFKSLATIPVAIVGVGFGSGAGHIVGYTAGALGYKASIWTANIVDALFKPAAE